MICEEFDAPCKGLTELQRRNRGKDGEVSSSAARKRAEKRAAKASGGLRHKRGADFSQPAPDVLHDSMETDWEGKYLELSRRAVYTLDDLGLAPKEVAARLRVPPRMVKRLLRNNLFRAYTPESEDEATQQPKRGDLWD